MAVAFRFHKVDVLALSGDVLCRCAIGSPYTVSDLKLTIEADTGKPTCDQQLVHRGHILHDHQTLQDVFGGDLRPTVTCVRSPPEEVATTWERYLSEGESCPVFYHAYTGELAWDVPDPAVSEEAKALRLAAQCGDTDGVMAYFGHGVNDQCLSHLWFALNTASISGQVMVVELLLAKFTEHARPGTNRALFLQRALDSACHLGHIDVMKYLLDYNASLEQPNVEGSLPLHSAACGGQYDAMLELLRYSPPSTLHTTTLELDTMDAQLDAQNGNGETPLILAAMFGHSECVELLLDAKSDVGAKTNMELTACDCAAFRGQHALAKRLQQLLPQQSPSSHSRA